MGKTSLTDRRERLVRKKQQIDARLKTLDARAQTQARKDDTRRKVVAGALALKHAELNPGGAFALQLIALISHEIDTATNPKTRESLNRLFAGFLPDATPPDAPR